MSTWYQELAICRRDLEESGLTFETSRKVARFALQECFNKDYLTKTYDLAKILFPTGEEVQPVLWDIDRDFQGCWIGALIATGTMKHCSVQLSTRRAGNGVRKRFWSALFEYLYFQLRIKKVIVDRYRPVTAGCYQRWITMLDPKDFCDKIEGLLSDDLAKRTTFDAFRDEMTEIYSFQCFSRKMELGTP